MKAKIEIRIWSDDAQPSSEDLPELFEPHVEHVTGLLRQGYCCGQVCDERFNGWWEIVVEDES